MFQSYLNIKTLCVLLSLTLSWSPASFESVVAKTNNVFVEIPVLKVNVYVMGREDITTDVSLAIGENFDYLNEEFEGKIKFIFNELFLDPNQAYLPDLRNGFFTENQNPVTPVVKEIEKSGSVNVYIFDTYIEEDQEVALTGFTPILRSGIEKYYLNTPDFDRILISYEALFDKSTLVHEFGHFFGLQHPWEMTAFGRRTLGMLSKKDEESNHMSYGSGVHKFTATQLDQMRKHVLKYRWYLLDHIEKVKQKV